MDNKDKKIKDLEARLAIYESDASAKFYAKLVKAIDHIGVELDNKTLDLDNDTFASSVLTLADKSGKIFEGLKNGRESFKVAEPGQDNDLSKKKKIAKMGDQVAM